VDVAPADGLDGAGEAHGRGVARVDRRPGQGVDAATDAGLLRLADEVRPLSDSNSGRFRISGERPRDVARATRGRACRPCR
jgi:hypothetical protein